MKDLSIEQKVKRYDKAVEIAEKYHNGTLKDVMETIFPALKESGDERIRKGLIKAVSRTFEGNTLFGTDVTREEALAWLEKQSKETKWCHHKVDLSACSEEYRKAYYDGWNNCNMQHSQYQSESNDVIKCLINGMRFYYEDNDNATWGTEKFHMKVKDILAWLEKQSEQKPVNKPKFKVGDMVVSTRNPHLTYKILQVGLPNELGKLDYEVEIFTDGKAGIKVGNTFEEHNIHLISCDNMEAWGIVRL